MAPWARQDFQDNKDQQAIMVTQVILGRRELKALKVLWDRKERLGRRELLGRKVQRVQKVTLVILGHKVLQAQLVPLVH